MVSGGKVSLSSRRTKRTRSPRANYSSLTLTPYSLDASINRFPLTEWIRLPSDAARAHYAGWKLLHLQRRTHPLSPLRCRRAEVRRRILTPCSSQNCRRSPSRILQQQTQPVPLGKPRHRLSQERSGVTDQVSYPVRSSPHLVLWKRSEASQLC
jgi:hypothetical protein